MRKTSTPTPAKAEATSDDDEVDVAVERLRTCAVEAPDTYKIIRELLGWPMPASAYLVDRAVHEIRRLGLLVRQRAIEAKRAGEQAERDRQRAIELEPARARLRERAAEIRRASPFDLTARDVAGLLEAAREAEIERAEALQVAGLHAAHSVVKAHDEIAAESARRKQPA